MPGRVNTRLVKRAGQRLSSSQFGTRTRMKFKESGKRIFETATKSLKETALRKAEDTAIEGIERITQDIAEKIKTPIGVNGRNLNLFKMQLLDQPAIGGTTESTSMFSYRPKRAVKTSDTIQYRAIRNKKLSLTSIDGSQKIADRNLAVLEPPQGDTLSSDDSCTNFSIRNEFDKMILARVVTPAGEQNTLKDTLIANFHTLSSVMILKAPSTGAIVEIYDLQPKFGIAGAVYSSESYSAGYLSPFWAWSEGLKTTSIIETMDNYTASVVGADPIASPKFRRTWNIIKKTTVRMTNNSIHRHRFVFNINKSVTYDEMAQASTQGGTVPWLPTQLVVVRGYPSASSLADPVTVEIQQESQLSYSSRLAKTSSVIVYNNNT